MSLRTRIVRRTFHFGFDARTSRGLMKDRTSWFLIFHDDKDPEIKGIGECAPLQGLSKEFTPEFEDKLNAVVALVNEAGITNIPKSLEEIHNFTTSQLQIDSTSSSIMFAIETGLLDLASGGTRKIFESSFSKGEAIPINGLIWMGGMDFMLQQIEIKIRDGFRCIKIKVGGLDFERECDVLQYVRRKYFREDITIRLDANGAFKPDDAMYKLKELSRFTIHSIEQPLKPGSPLLPALCASSPIPVALDEELIGVVAQDARQKLLAAIKPHYLVLKPTLHGGFRSVADWIERAGKAGIGWWVTSALESNIGLNAIAQFTSRYNPEIHQGLGTGAIYDDNIPSPLEVSGQNLRSNSAENWGQVEQN